MVGKRSGGSLRGMLIGSGGGATLNTYGLLVRISNTSIASVLCGLRYRIVWATEFSESAILRNVGENLVRKAGRKGATSSLKRAHISGGAGVGNAIACDLIGINRTIRSCDHFQRFWPSHLFRSLRLAYTQSCPPLKSTTSNLILTTDHDAVQFQPEDMMLDSELDYTSDRTLPEVLEVIESSDETLAQLAEDFGIQFVCDSSVLTLEQRKGLSNKCLAALGYEPYFTASCEIREEAKKPNEGEMTKEEIEALGKQFDYDGSRLTSEQRRALFKSYWAMHLKMLGLRSPQYYGDKSQCLSVSETAWPGTVTYLEAEKLKRSYIEPKDLIERLHKLKPSDNFELRKFRHPRMEWKSPTPLQEEGLEIGPSWPEWVMDQLYAVTDMERRSGRQWADQHRQKIRNRWAAFESGVELTALPDLHLLRDMGRSPDGTQFPWYLVKGLMTLREHANETARKSYGEAYDSAMVERQEAINRWRERNSDSILADDPISIYRTWPADLMAELDEIEREAIRCGRRKYVGILREMEKKMQALVSFWRGCGLVTGQRTPPSLWWQDPKRRVKRLPKPQYLQERLDAIEAEFGYHSDMGEKLRMIEMSRWMESIINGDSEPTTSDALPQSLLEELDIVWQDRHWLDNDDTEDEMIARIRRRRKSKHHHCVEEGLRTSQQLGSDTGLEEPVHAAGSPVCSGQENLLQNSVMDVVIAPEEPRQLRENLSRGACRQPTMNPTPKDWAIWRSRLRPRTKTEVKTSWRNRLRPRPDADGASREKTKATKAQSGKPQGIVKGRKALKKNRLPATKSQATSTIEKTDLSHFGTQSHFNESSSQTIPRSVAKVRGTKNLKCRSPKPVQHNRKVCERHHRIAQGPSLITLNDELTIGGLFQIPKLTS